MMTMMRKRVTILLHPPPATPMRRLPTLATVRARLRRQARSARPKRIPSSPQRRPRPSLLSKIPDPRTCFVGNLSWNIDDEWLYREFEEFGEITRANVLTDRESWSLQGFRIRRVCQLSICCPLLSKPRRVLSSTVVRLMSTSPLLVIRLHQRIVLRTAPNNTGDSKNPPSDTLFLGNLSFDATEDVVGEAFGEHGTVVNVRLPTDQLVPSTLHTVQ
jgi:nucleolin